MATQDATNTSQLVAFSSVGNHERRLIIMRSEGKPYAELVTVARNEFNLRWTESYIRHLFSVGGRLEQAYREYNDALAGQSLREAKQLAQRASKAAIITMTELMGAAQEPTIRLNAAKALANKFVPDRQIVFDGGAGESDIPDEIANAGVALLEEAENGPEQVDDPQQGQPTGEVDGGGERQEVSEAVLPQPDSTSGPSDPPA